MKIDGKFWDPENPVPAREGRHAPKLLFCEVINWMIERFSHKDGVGVEIEFSEREEWRFNEILQMGHPPSKLGIGLLEMIVKELDRLGRQHSKLRCTYENRVFQIFVDEETKKEEL